MQEIYNLKRDILKQKSVHIMSLSFEERCLAYPNALKYFNLSAKQHTFFCINLPDDNLCEFLKSQRENHHKDIKDKLPPIQFVTINEILEKILDITSPHNIFIDISSLPRVHIFHLLQKIFEISYDEIRIFIIYAYPKEYLHGHLQESAPVIDCIFDTPKPTRGQKVTALVLPGFDIEYTNTAFTYLTSKADCELDELDLHWLIPFPGRKYSFYERVLETHFTFLKKDKVILYPQEELELAFDRLKKELKTLGDSNIYIIPLGCRIICIPVFLVTLWARKKGKKVNIILPRTRKYDSIRSEGYIDPLIKEIPYDNYLLEQQKKDEDL